VKEFVHRQLVHISKNLTSWNQVVRQHSLLQMARQRMIIAGGVLTFGFLIISARLFDVMVLKQLNTFGEDCPTGMLGDCGGVVSDFARADILDRNGEVIATNLKTGSIYANPKVVLSPEQAAVKLAKLLPHIGEKTLLKRLKSAKGFVWLARHIPPKIQHEINNLGIPGVYLMSDHRRVYPRGKLAGHILGYCGIDNKGLAGVEKTFDQRLSKDKKPLRLTIDMRAQHILEDELQKAVEYYNASGGNAIIMDIKTGAIIAISSNPCPDPNTPERNKPEHNFNRNTLGVNEPGSVFKIINIAIALETGSANLRSVYDASAPVKIGRFMVTDFKGKNRTLSLAEAFMFSSNIAAIKIAQQFGMQSQVEYFKKFGVFKPTKLEVSENGYPLIPANWTPVTTMTASYGYGFAVTPLSSLTIVAGIVNNGIKPTPTLLMRDETSNDNLGAVKIISDKTSQTIRDFMRLNARDGTAKAADIGNYMVFAKTGTAYQAKRGNYGAVKSRTTSCIGGFPYNNPRYVFLVMLDDPKALKETHGYATAGWNAAPTAGKIIERVAPILGVPPKEDENKDISNITGWGSFQQTGG